jgi:hypothetical protein
MNPVLQNQKMRTHWIYHSLKKKSTKKTFAWDERMSMGHHHNTSMCYGFIFADWLEPPSWRSGYVKWIGRLKATINRFAMNCFEYCNNASA